MATSMLTSNSALRIARPVCSVGIVLGVLALGVVPCTGGPKSREGSGANPGTNKAVDHDEMRVRFEKAYAAFHDRIAKDPRIQFSSIGGSEYYERYDEYGALLRLGPGAVPFMIEKIANREGYRYGTSLIPLVERIARIDPGPPHDVIGWWKARAATPAKFEKAYAEWKRARSTEPRLLQIEETVYDDEKRLIKKVIKKTDLGRAFDALRAFGLDSLPHVVEKLREGDGDLIPLFDDLVGGNCPATEGTGQERIASILAWWNEHERDFLLPPVSAAKLKEDKR